jgi:preprotein translocase subunit Sss1
MWVFQLVGFGFVGFLGYIGHRKNHKP